MLASEDEVARAAAMFAALGHPRRVELLRGLARWSNSPSELAREMKCSWTTIAKHLDVLRRAGLVERYRSEFGTGFAYVVSHGALERVARCVRLLE